MKCLSPILLFLLVSITLAQTSPTESQTEKDKKQKALETQVLHMLDDAISEAGMLKLPQNRALVYAMAGDLYWKFDEKRARKLFRDAANDLIVKNGEAEKEKKESDDPYFGVYEWGDVRNQILPLVAKHDADLALEMLVQTRPTKLSEAIAKAALANAKQDSGYLNFNPDQYRVREELALEQQLAILAADQDPDKAVKLIKESLAKGISWNILPLLQKLHKKDAKKATQLAGDIVKKIAETDLTKKSEDLNSAVNLVQSATNPNAPKSPKEKPFKFTDAQLKDLANKIADTFLEPGNSLTVSMAMTTVMAALEQLVPEKMPALKLKQAELAKNLPPEIKKMQKQQKLWNQSTTPEEIIAELPNLDEAERATAYNSLLNKIATVEDEGRAKKLIEQIPDEKIRETATDRFESARIERTAKDGKLDEAKGFIGKLTKKSVQVQKLVSLAVDFYKKGTEKDREAAISLMKDAKALTKDFPEDESDLNDVMELVRGYATVNPNEAFRIFEPLLDEINDYVQASAILSKYAKYERNFKKRELIMKVTGNSWEGFLLFKYIGQLQLLGKADLDRMSLLADKFARNDSRTIVKLFIAQGFLKEEKKNSDGSEGDGAVMFYSF